MKRLAIAILLLAAASTLQAQSTYNENIAAAADVNDGAPSASLAAVASISPAVDVNDGAPSVAHTPDTTTVSGFYTSAVGGGALSGRLVISWKAFKTAGGSSIPGGSQGANVTAGNFSVNLVPNEGASPVGTSYAVCWLPTGSSTCQNETWVVPASSTYVDVATVRRFAPPTQFSGIQVEESDGSPTQSANTIVVNQADFDLTYPVAGQATVAIDATVMRDAELAANTATFTNKTYDAEATGNVFTSTTLLEFIAGKNEAGTPAGECSTPVSNAPAVTAVSGSNVLFATYNFDAATDESIQCRVLMPADFSGAVDLDLIWRAASTSGDTVWGLQTICVADAETGDPAFNTASTITDTAKGTTLQFNTASTTGITITGCAAGELMFLRFFRDADAGGDTMTGDAELISFRLKMRRAQ